MEAQTRSSSGWLEPDISPGRSMTSTWQPTFMNIFIQIRALDLYCPLGTCLTCFVASTFRPISWSWLTLFFFSIFPTKCKPFSWRHSCGDDNRHSDRTLQKTWSQRCSSWRTNVGRYWDVRFHIVSGWDCWIILLFYFWVVEQSPGFFPFITTTPPPPSPKTKKKKPPPLHIGTLFLKFDEDWPTCFMNKTCFRIYFSSSLHSKQVSQGWHGRGGWRHLFCQSGM